MGQRRGRRCSRDTWERGPVCLPGVARGRPAIPVCPGPRGSPSHRTCSATSETDSGEPGRGSPCTAWALPTQPCSLHSCHTLSDRAYALCPPSPAPHCPLLSQSSHHLLEVSLNSLPPSGPQVLPLSAEVGADVLEFSPPPGSCAVTRALVLPWSTLPPPPTG